MGMGKNGYYYSDTPEGNARRRDADARWEVMQTEKRNRMMEKQYEEMKRHNREMEKMEKKQQQERIRMEQQEITRQRMERLDREAKERLENLERMSYTYSNINDYQDDEEMENDAPDNPKEQVVQHFDMNPENAVNFKNRGMLCLEDGEFEKAMQFFELTLDINPNESDAHLGKFLVKNGLTSLDELVKNTNIDLEESKDFMRALKFAEGEKKEALEKIIENRKLKIEQNKEEGRQKGKQKLIEYLEKNTKVRELNNDKVQEIFEEEQKELDELETSKENLENQWLQLEEKHDSLSALKFIEKKNIENEINILKKKFSELEQVKKDKKKEYKLKIEKLVEQEIFELLDIKVKLYGDCPLLDKNDVEGNKKLIQPIRSVFKGGLSISRMPINYGVSCIKVKRIIEQIFYKKFPFLKDLDYDVDGIKNEELESEQKYDRFFYIINAIDEGRYDNRFFYRFIEKKGIYDVNIRKDISEFCEEYNRQLQNMNEALKNQDFDVENVERYKIKSSDFLAPPNGDGFFGEATVQLEKENYKIMLKVGNEENILAASLDYSENDDIEDIDVRRFYLPFIMTLLDCSCEDAIEIWKKVMNRDVEEKEPNGVWCWLSDETNALFIVDTHAERLNDLLYNVWKNIS